MDDNQIAKLVEHYSNMTDEELSYLVVTRLNSLTEEARYALSKALKSRNLSKFDNELNATYEDVTIQAKNAQLDAENREKIKRETHNTARFICVFGMGVGLLIAIFDNLDSGVSFGAVWACLLLYFEVRRFLRRIFKITYTES